VTRADPGTAGLARPFGDRAWTARGYRAPGPGTTPLPVAVSVGPGARPDTGVSVTGTVHPRHTTVMIPTLSRRRTARRRRLTGGEEAAWSPHEVVRRRGVTGVGRLSKGAW
jgi:hypothetical protein